jgi:hypothetical protein
MLEAKSVVSKALAVACPACRAVIGDPCVQADGKVVEVKGHLGVHAVRLLMARHVKKATA